MRSPLGIEECCQASRAVAEFRVPLNSVAPEGESFSNGKAHATDIKMMAVLIVGCFSPPSTFSPKLFLKVAGQIFPSWPRTGWDPKRSLVILLTPMARPRSPIPANAHRMFYPRKSACGAIWLGNWPRREFRPGLLGNLGSVKPINMGK